MVKIFFRAAFEKHAAAMARAGCNPNNGLGDVLEKLKRLPDVERAAIEVGLADSSTPTRTPTLTPTPTRAVRSNDVWGET